MLAAIAGLAGVAIGSVITGVVTLRAEHKRQQFAKQQGKHQESREQERAEQHHQRELKKAARLIDEELHDATELIQDAIYQVRPPPEIPVSNYIAYRHILAVNLDDPAWAGVSLAFHQIRQVNRTYGTPEQPEGTQPFGPIDRIDILSIGLQVIMARQSLAPFSNPPDKEALLNQNANDIASAIFPLPEEEPED
jgi:hypothetical protein